MPRLQQTFLQTQNLKDEDSSDMVAFRDGLENLSGQQLKDFILDNTDVPELINYDALTTILKHQDWGFYKNMYQYRDTEGTGRWSILPWDLDNALSMPIFKPETSPMYFSLDPLQANNQQSYMDQRLTEKAMYQFPEFREMYYRRVASLYDQIYKSGQLLGWYTELYNKSKDTIDQDLVKWQADKAALLSMAYPSGIPWEFQDDFPFNITPEQAMSGEQTAADQDTIFRYGYNKFIQEVDSERSSGDLPQPQNGNPEIIFSEVNYAPTGGEDSQYIELYNPGSTAVDISGWQLSGTVTASLPQGSVVPASSYVVIVKNDPQFRQTYSGSQLVLTEYQGSLANNFPSQLTLSSNGQTVATLNYDVSSPWPSSDGGFSLALTKLSGDYTSPYCWAPSASVGGTPGLANSLNQDWVAQNITKCQNRVNEVGASATTSLAGTGQSYSTLLLLGLLLISTPVTLTLYLKSYSK
jgi:hypothetical protein